MCARSAASKFESGSSNKKSCGSRTIARPIATRWRCPPESLAGFRSKYSSIFRVFATLAIFAAMVCLSTPRFLSP
ncbi:Protein of uncharacterised function (DUF1602) [Vibrio cholerae]|nr:Protein of uncharacterised function (DUF1602) [Vibrio cholerae]